MTAGSPALLLVIRGGAATLGGVMATKPSSPLGARRQAAGYTQERFAEELGVDRSTVGRWERGVQAPLPWQRPDIATALKITLDQLDNLLREPAPGFDIPVVTELHTLASSYTASLEPLRRVVLGRSRTTHVEPPALSDAAASAKMNEAHRLYQSADYDGTADLLPALVQQFDSFVGGTNGHVDPSQARIAAATYIAAAKLATKQADAGLAWVTADRALRLAAASGHHGLVGAANYQVACALLRAGHDSDAEQVAAGAADDMLTYVADELAGQQQREMISARGALLLLSAILAARRGGGTDAQRYLSAARQLAEQLGVDGNWLWTAFGPTNVAIHEVAVRIDLGDTKQAMELGTAIDTDGLPNVLAGRRSQVHLDLARASVQQGEDSRAVLHLLEAERVAAQAISRNAVVRSLLNTLLARERRGSTPGLRALVIRADVLQ
jgi:transcriptional regulator with XRE-family HTH domain